MTSWIVRALKLSKQRKEVNQRRKMRITLFMYNLNSMRTGGHENGGYQTYPQHHPQLHEMNHLLENTKEL